MMDIAAISKAVAGGIVGLLVAEAARYGFRPSADQITLLGAVVTGVVGYVVGHVIVYFAPKNTTPGI